MKIHYGTALAAVALVAVHILMRLTMNFAEKSPFHITNVGWLSAFAGDGKWMTAEEAIEKGIGHEILTAKHYKNLIE